MRLIDTNTLATRICEQLLRCNAIFESFFEVEAPRLAEACRELYCRYLTLQRV
jgi:hypothetical protein